MFLINSAGSLVVSAAMSIFTTCACKGLSCVSSEVVRTSARLAYSILFFLSMVLAWVLRDYAKPLLMKIPCAFHESWGCCRAYAPV